MKTIARTRNPVGAMLKRKMRVRDLGAVGTFAKLFPMLAAGPAAPGSKRASQDRGLALSGALLIYG